MPRLPPHDLLCSTSQPLSPYLPLTTFNLPLSLDSAILHYHLPSLSSSIRNLPPSPPFLSLSCTTFVDPIPLCLFTSFSTTHLLQPSSLLTPLPQASCLRHRPTGEPRFRRRASEGQVESRDRSRAPSRLEEEWCYRFMEGGELERKGFATIGFCRMDAKGDSENGFERKGAVFFGSFDSDRKRWR